MSAHRTTIHSARYGAGVRRTGADWVCPPAPLSQWQRDRASGPIAPMDPIIAGFHVPAWCWGAVGIAVTVVVIRLIEWVLP